MLFKLSQGLLLLAMVFPYLGCGDDPRPTGSYLLESTPSISSSCTLDFSNWLIQYAGALRPGSPVEMEPIGKNSILLSFEAGLDVLVSTGDKSTGIYSGSFLETFETQGCLLTQDLSITLFDRDGISEILARERWVIDPITNECLWEKGSCQNDYAFFVSEL